MILNGGWFEMEVHGTLETERLILRPFAADDFEAVHSWAGNPANTRYMGWGPNSREETRRFLEAAKAGNDFAAVIKGTEKVIGSCGIYPDDGNDTAELGWILHMDHWKNGYGTELGGELIRCGFENLKLRRLTAPCAAVNYGSRRVMERNGMRREATHIKGFWLRVDKEWVDEARYAILAEEYFSGKADVSIIPYCGEYFGDMLLCFLSARDSISRDYAPEAWRKPELKEDLLDIKRNYTDRGEIFYLAADRNGRVVGMVGTQTEPPSDMWLKRLYVKPEMKGRGIGGKLLAAVEEYALSKGISAIHTRFADWYREAAVFYPAKGFADVKVDGHMRYMVKRLK
jgi:RimJ/RimL family protein N-acetyltransferase